MDDQLQALLLQALLPGGAGAASVALDQALAQNGEADPTTALLTQYLLQQQGAADEDENDEDDAADGPALRRELAAARTELEELRRRNDIVAAAVGACEVCWGDDPACPVCAGAGGPGWGEPNRGLFAEIVGPALQQVRRRRAMSGVY
jgi:hypothetical protein